MPSDGKDLLEQLDRHLGSPNQAWLFGAGISMEAGVPLMNPLTARVLAMANGKPQQAILDALVRELPPDSHIEHLLSHLGDYAALAQRAKMTEVTIGETTVTAQALGEAHTQVVHWIAETVRWGYRAATVDNPEAIGCFDNSLVSIDGHRAFIQALFETAQAGLRERRGPVRLFSTNYDTLLEDALALCGVSYWDGFSGGGVAFRNYQFGQDVPGGDRSQIIKLHGSIDWYLSEEGRIFRVRDGDSYPARTGRVLIYPQATKYAATQRDPFAAQFDIFRRTLATTADNVLAVCGYSFGDDHINEEIESAMLAGSKTTVIVFSYEGTGLPDCLRKWRASSWGKRLYIATEKGLYVGDTGPYYGPIDNRDRTWWTFAGVTKLLKDGAEGCI